MNIGSIRMSGRSAASYTFGTEVWLLCNGAVAALADYPLLGALIGATYGAAPAGFFRLPNYSSDGVVGSRAPMGASPAGVALGASLGSETHDHVYPAASFLAHNPPNVPTDVEDLTVNIQAGGPDLAQGAPHTHLSGPVLDHDISGLPVDVAASVSPYASVTFYIRAK